VRPLGGDEAAGVLAGFGYDGSDAARRRLVQSLPLVALRRRQRVDTSRYDTAT
jgi:hypothetical protein